MQADVVWTRKIQQTAMTKEELDCDYELPSTSKFCQDLQRTIAVKKNYHVTSDIITREHGLRGYVWSKLAHGFENRYTGYIMKQLKVTHEISPGVGIYQEKVLNFNKKGDLFCCTSPLPAAGQVQLWDWDSKTLKIAYYPQGKQERICDLKFIEINEGLNLLFDGFGGELTLSTILPSGGAPVNRLLYDRGPSAAKLALCPQNPFLIYSATANGIITKIDIRAPPMELNPGPGIEISYPGQFFSIAHHPLKSEICVSCNDNCVRVYDARMMKDVVHDMYLDEYVNSSCPCLTCTAVYNCTGSEILCSYSYLEHVLFNNKIYTPGSFVHRYSGHYQTSTLLRMTYSRSNAKFFGMTSEYVISSTEFGSICVWDKFSEKIIDIIGDNTLSLDEELLEPHPHEPIIASWQKPLQNNIRIWSPSKDDDSDDTKEAQSHSVVRNLELE